MTEEELLDDPECVSGLVPDPEHPPGRLDRSMAYTFRFPDQDTKLGPGTQVDDPATEDAAGAIVSIDRAAGRLVLKRGPSLEGVALPRVLMPNNPYNTRSQRAALRRFAREVLASGLVGDGPYRALRDLVLREPPRVVGTPRGATLQGEHLDFDDAW